MANSSNAILRVAFNEGGYNLPYGKSGETYVGIDRLHKPNWKGWKIIDVVKKSKRIPNEGIINNPDLNAAVVEFYQEFWTSSGSGQILNEKLAEFYFDFYFHKPAIAVGFMNEIAMKFDSKVKYAGATLSTAVVAIANKNASFFYQLLWQDRHGHYADGLHPSLYKGERIKYIASKKGVLSRLNRYPPKISE